MSKLDRKIMAQQKRESQLVKKKIVFNKSKTGHGGASHHNTSLGGAFDALPSFDNRPKLEAIESLIAQ